MKKSLWRTALMVAAIALLPQVALAAGGGATELVVVADVRMVTGVERYFADLYNTNIVLFATWATILTALYGCFLGFFMDFLIARTGLDLSSRKIVEH